MSLVQPKIGISNLPNRPCLLYREPILEISIKGKGILSGLLFHIFSTYLFFYNRIHEIKNNIYKRQSTKKLFQEKEKFLLPSPFFNFGISNIGSLNNRICQFWKKNLYLTCFKLLFLLKLIWSLFSYISSKYYLENQATFREHR